MTKSKCGGEQIFIVQKLKREDTFFDMEKSDG